MFLRKNVDFGVYHDVLKKPKHHETVHLTMLIAHPYHPLKQKWCNILAEFSLTFTDWQSQVNAREKSYWPFDQLMHISSSGDNLCSKLLSFPIQSNRPLDINNNNPSIERRCCASFLKKNESWHRLLGLKVPANRASCFIANFLRGRKAKRSSSPIDPVLARINLAKIFWSVCRLECSQWARARHNKHENQFLQRAIFPAPVTEMESVWILFFYCSLSVNVTWCFGTVHLLTLVESL